MTRKDYELIARALKDAAEAVCYNKGQRDAVHQASRYVAGALRTTNPAFNRERFIAACGVSN